MLPAYIAMVFNTGNHVHQHTPITSTDVMIHQLGIIFLFGTNMQTTLVLQHFLLCRLVKSALIIDTFMSSLSSIRSLLAMSLGSRLLPLFEQCLHFLSLHFLNINIMTFFVGGKSLSFKTKIYKGSLACLSRLQHKLKNTLIEGP